MDKLSDIQLRKMSHSQLESLIDALYEKYDGLKSTIKNNVWVGDYGGVSSKKGVNATKEADFLKLYIKTVEGIAAEKDKRPPRRVKTPISSPNNKVTEPHEIYFSTYAEAKEWSMNDIGRAFSRSPDGIGFIPVNKERG